MHLARSHGELRRPTEAVNNEVAGEDGHGFEYEEDRADTEEGVHHARSIHKVEAER